MKISLVAAIAENNAIGKNNQLLWHLPDDFKFFKSYTMGKVIVMGRKTFESIGKKALPGRTNVVISRSDLSLPEGVLLFNNLEEMKQHFITAEEICIIGGAQIYEQSMEMATHLVITRVHTTPQDADVFFPLIDETKWKLDWEEKHLSDEKHAFDFTFCIYSGRD